MSTDPMFAAELSGALVELRGLAESLMLDACVVTRVATDADPDPWGNTPRVVVYAGKAKSQTFAAYERTPESGEAQITVQRYYVHFPVGFDPQEGDVVEWTHCPRDPARVGAKERVTAPFGGTMKTARRVPTDRIAGDG